MGSLLARSWVAAVVVFGMSFGACTPGYMNASELNRKEQGPSHCAARCEQLGMRMAALVLVSDQLPGCVCEPLGRPKASADGAADVGASAATTGYVVIAAAAAAARQQQVAQQQQQRSTTGK